MTGEVETGETSTRAAYWGSWTGGATAFGWMAYFDNKVGQEQERGSD